MAEGYLCSKKNDGICAVICEQGIHGGLIMSRLKCIVRGNDFKSLLLFLMIIPCCLFGVFLHGQKITYFLRPLWDHPPRPFTKITHYYSDNVTMESLCKLHGWSIRDYPRRVFDAVLFNNEVDMLDIRWNELYPYVTQFVLLESNSTFTGISKPLYFVVNRDRFQFIEGRLTYGTIGGRLRKGENPFVEEAYQRMALDQLLRISGIEEDDLLIMSDVDEIPSRHTINLLRWCNEVPLILHLQLRNYLYSFEYHVDDNSWRASVHRYKPGVTQYAHFRQTDLLLSDAGWHCSFCFQHISDFIFKMKAYSHTDRVRFSYYLNPKRIQDIICKGTNLFDMLPEEYTFRDMIGKLGAVPRSYSAVHLPTYIIQNVEKFKYLLPGNCLRESG